MRVLLLSPNMESLPDPVFPIGLAYISGALEKNGIPHRILDLCFAEDFENAIQTAVADFKPEIVAVSLRNIDNVAYPNYISYVPFYKQVIDCIRRNSRALVILGGSGFSLIPYPLMEYLGADAGISGEGEVSLVKFLRRFRPEKAQDPFRASRHIDLTNEVITDLDSLPLPRRSEFDCERYTRQGGMVNIQTKRGCPFHCVYCTYPVIEGKEIRLRNPVHVCDEIENLIETGVTHLFFVDNTFNFPIEHASAICREMIRRRLPVKWGCYTNPKFITREFVDLLHKAGCTGLEFGSDAANDGMLLNMGKNFTVKDLERASAICKDSGMPFCHSLLLGGPGETMETVRETLQRVIHMGPTAVICMVGIRVFPNTRLSALGEREGIIAPDEHFLKPVFYLSPAIEDTILPFIGDFSKEHPSWIFPGLNINIDTGLQKKLRRFGIKGPLWEQMGRVRKVSH